MLVFENDFKYTNPFTVVFLCGSHFEADNKRDKRSIIAAYITKNFPNVKPIILEENFAFKPSQKKYLYYDDVFLKNLSDVEELAALFAERIIIIHDTFSTAAEIGMFASNSALMKKVCILTPDRMSVEGDGIKGFIQLAFNNLSTPEQRVKVVQYYPDVEVQRYSERKSGYLTYFHDDKIGEFLGNAIESFIGYDFIPERISYNQVPPPNNASTDPQIVDFNISKSTLKVSVSVSAEILRIQLISMLLNGDIRRELRKGKELYKHVSYIEKEYKEILRNTITELSFNKDISAYDFEYNIKKTDCTLRMAIGYYLYLLQATGYLKIEGEEKVKDSAIRSISVTASFTNQERIQILKKMLKPIKKTMFGGLGL